jgi:drug/metabolite transporter (DMT)-like permease
MTILFALLAAFSNALSLITQHVASVSNPEKARGWRLIPYLFKNTLWLFGWVALGGAFLFQALALHDGEMALVQPLLITELVFVLVLRRVWLHQDIRSITWWSAAVTCVALALFVAMADPQGGKTSPSGRAWVSATEAALGATAVLALFGLWGSPRRRAALFASATAIMWALVATFIKQTTETISQSGLNMFVHWPVYALAASGLAATILDQVTLHIGPLSVSQPFLVIVDPIASIVLSVWIFDEMFSSNPARVALAVVAFATTCAAVTTLINTAPGTIEPTSAPADAAA